MNKTSPYFAIWLVASAIAIFMAMQFFSAAFADGQYIPVGNDSFYHARRILDTAIGARGFYQFDNMIHVPEGSWLNWPWAYDYLMALALGAALWINPDLEPMAFLAYVPVAWVLVNFGLFTLIGRQIKLGAGFTAIALLGFALLPLNQYIHGVGAIDHHYFELTFVLATLLSGLRYFSGGFRVSDAVTLGIVLGIAPAFHNGLFILQIPILATVFALWVRRAKLAPNSLHWLAGALVVSTLMISLPSAPFREMQFEFWTLSWFHLYVAASSAICLLYFGWRSFSRINLVLLVVVGAMLVLPMMVKVLLGAAFLAGDLILLDQIAEVQSPASHLSDDGGYFWVARNYSWFIFLAPLYIVLFAIRSWQSVDPQRVYFSIFAVFGTLLMLTQFRLHPFGSWVLFLGGMLLVDELRTRFNTSYLIASAASILILAIAFQPALRSQLFFIYSAGGTRDYAAARFLFPSLAAECSRQSGTVLSYSDDGHYIRYHTDCSVLTNNFLMTPLHEKKILEGSVLLEMTPEQFIQFAPDVQYIFVRMYGVYDLEPTGWQPAPVGDVIARNSLLFVALTFSQTVPDGFRLISEARVDDDRDFAYARVFEVVRDNEPKTPEAESDQ